MFQVISPSRHNPKRAVVRWEFQTLEDAEEFVKSVKIIEVQTVEKSDVGNLNDVLRER